MGMGKKVTQACFDFLFPPSPPYVRHSDTSKAAAESVRESAPTMRERVLTCIRHNGNLTCFEVEQILSMAHQTASARIRELALKGKIRDSGKRRATGSGRKAVVWVVV